MKGQCIDCGGECLNSSTRCKKCSNVQRSAYFASGAPGQHRDEVAAMFLTGASLKEMAKHFNMTPGSMGVLIHRLRTDYGYDLPYRRKFTAEGLAFMKANGEKNRRC
jgi:hypothetical protein